MKRTSIFAAALLVALAKSTAAAALFSFEAPVETAGGELVPCIIVGLNADTRGGAQFLGGPDTHPMFTWSNSLHEYQIAFGFDAGAERAVRFDTSIMDGPTPAGLYHYRVVVVDEAGNSHAFDVFFDLATEGTLDADGWFVTKPTITLGAQYEDKTIQFNFDVIPNSPTSVTLGVQVQNADTGDFASFHAVPEPASLALLGIAGPVLLRRRAAGGRKCAIEIRPPRVELGTS